VGKRKTFAHPTPAAFRILFLSCALAASVFTVAIDLQEEKAPATPIPDPERQTGG
jgi:hypothetical protein